MPGRLRFARAQKRRVPGEMTKTEQRFAETLEASRLAGEIESWRFEDFRLVLAKNTSWTPDFCVIDNEGFITFYEVKSSGGYKVPNQDKSRVKIKVAAERFPEFRFVAAIERRKQDGGGFEFENVEPAVTQSTNQSALRNAALSQSNSSHFYAAVRHSAEGTNLCRSAGIRCRVSGLVVVRTRGDRLLTGVGLLVAVMR